MLKSIQLKNFLSYGPTTKPLELESLNVLVGPNGAGKSNLLEGLAVLRSAPTDIAAAIRIAGGIRDLVHKRAARARPSPDIDVWSDSWRDIASIEVALENPEHAVWSQVTNPFESDPSAMLRYRIALLASGASAEVVDERLEDCEPAVGKVKPYFYFGIENGRPMLNYRDGGKRELRRDTVDSRQSILAQRKDPVAFPELTFVGEQFKKIRMYRDWSTGRATALRMGQLSDDHDEFLREDFSNLALVVNRLLLDQKTKHRFLELLKQVNGSVTDLRFVHKNNRLEMVLEESGRYLPATRISDGTIRWICLLAIFLDTGASSLVCLEEPEIGLHPDMIRELANLLLSVSVDRQLLVTTHSDILIDALSSRPSAVVVCDQVDGESTCTRLSSEKLAAWLADYSLGDLWRRGQIGGNRW